MRNQRPFFSLVIPALNEEEALPLLLDDIVKQRYRNFEVIVVDGRSHDNTVKIAKVFADRIKRFTILSCPERNPCIQRNHGAEHATGTYLVFLDADVRIYHNYLSEIRSVILKTSSKFLTTYFLPDIPNTVDKLLTQVVDLTLELMARAGIQMAPEYNFIISRDVFTKVGGFDPKATFSEAHELSIRIWKQTHIPLRIIRKHLLEWSFRRIRKEGHVPVIVKYTSAVFHIMIFGKISDKNFGYPMGGDYFREIKSLNQEGVERWLRKALAKIMGE